MSSDVSKRTLDLALSLLGENKPKEALEVLDHMSSDADSSPERSAYRGLALAKLGNGAEALSLLRRAVALAPYDARMNFLLAIQLREIGKTEESRKYAEEARIIDPKFPGLAELMASLGMKSPDPRLRLRERLMNPLPPPPDGPVHAFPSIEEADSFWTVAGWTLALMNLIALALFRIHPPMHMPGPGQPQGVSFLGGLMPNADPVSIFTIFLLVFTLILCFLWTLVDIVDRRSRFEWLIPIVPFCVCGAPGIALALYMGMGRK